MESFINFRPLCSNIYTENNMIFRTGTVFRDNEEHFRIIKKYKIKYFIDFRTEKEIVTNTFLITRLEREGVKWFNYTINNYKDDKIEKNPTVNNYALYYLGILEHGKKGIYGFFKFLSNIPNIEPIVYGCSLGKDRTGIISYLLLNILEGRSSDIYNDYCITKDFLLSNSQVIQYFADKGVLDYEKRCNTDKNILKIFEKIFEKRYFSVSHYLCQIGITEADQINIKKKWGKKTIG